MLQQLHLRLVEFLTGEFICEYSCAFYKNCIVQEIFVCQLTPFLVTVINFIKERSKTEMSPWFCCCPLANVVERFWHMLSPVPFIYTEAGKSSILKMLLTTLKAKITRWKLLNGFCEYRRKFNHWSEFICSMGHYQGYRRFRCLCMAFLVSCCSEWTFLSS